MKIMWENYGLRNEYENDLCSNEHYFSSSENKVWKIKACTGFEPMTSAIPMNDFHIRFSYIHSNWFITSRVYYEPT